MLAGASCADLRRRFEMVTAILDRVVVKVDKSADRSRGGILLPEKGREEPKTGVVVACGPGKRLADGSTAPINVSVGDRVMFGCLAGTDVKLDGEELRVMAEEDVLGIIHE
jgi:chaperonin GroES